jgi:hypothetical protein
MKKSLFCVLSVAAVIGTALTSTAASAAVTATPAGDPATTTMTFAVTSGALTLTVPASAVLGSGAPGGSASGPLGAVSVADNRALLAASWTVTASSTNFVTGAGTTDEVIPVADETYDPGGITTTGRITATGTSRTLSTAAQTVVAGTAGVGNNTAAWDPTIEIIIPAAAVNGTYTATLTQSVS